MSMLKSKKMNFSPILGGSFLGGSLSDYCIIGGLVVAFGAGAFYVFGLTFQDTVNGTLSPLGNNGVELSAGNGGVTADSVTVPGDPIDPGSDPNGNPDIGGHIGNNTGVTGNTDPSNGGGLTGGGSGQGATGSSSAIGTNANWFGDSNNNETAGSNGVTAGGANSPSGGGTGGGGSFNNFGDPSLNNHNYPSNANPANNSGGSSSGGSAGGGSTQGSTVASGDSGHTSNSNPLDPVLTSGNGDTDYFIAGYNDPNYNPNNLQYNKVSELSLDSSYLRQIYAQGYIPYANPGYPGYPGYISPQELPKAATPTNKPPGYW